MSGKENNGIQRLSPAREIAYISVACALLLIGQYVFSFVQGVEIVTLLMAAFASVAGIKRGIVLSVAFTLLRCFIYGFAPTAVLLYLIYYPAFAAIMGLLGHISQKSFARPSAAVVIAVNVILWGLSLTCVLLYAFDVIKISKFLKAATNVFLWVIGLLCAGLAAAFNVLAVLKRKGKNIPAEIFRVGLFTAVACFCTVCFTLLDDVITPLFFGYTHLAALTYFYASFSAMLPQTVCTIATLSTLFVPVTRAISRPIRGFRR